MREACQGARRMTEAKTSLRRLCGFVDKFFCAKALMFPVGAGRRRRCFPLHQ
jgi:hypothetical protein